MYDDLAPTPDDSAYARQRAQQGVGSADPGLPRGIPAARGLPTVPPLRRGGSYRSSGTANSRGYGGDSRRDSAVSGASRGSRVSQDSRSRRRAKKARRPVWRQTPIPLAPTETFYAAATAESRYSTPSAGGYSARSSLRGTRSVGGRSGRGGDQSTGGDRPPPGRRAVRRSAPAHGTIDAGQYAGGGGPSLDRASVGGSERNVLRKAGSYRRMVGCV